MPVNRVLLCISFLVFFTVLPTGEVNAQEQILDDCQGADFEPAGDVDLADLKDFAFEWLSCNNPQDI